MCQKTYKYLFYFENVFYERFTANENIYIDILCAQEMQENI